jgi:hypothetical protein
MRLGDPTQTAESDARFAPKKQGKAESVRRQTGVLVGRVRRVIVETIAPGRLFSIASRPISAEA